MTPLQARLRLGFFAQLRTNSLANKLSKQDPIGKEALYFLTRADEAFIAATLAVLYPRGTPAIDPNVVDMLLSYYIGALGPSYEFARVILARDRHRDFRSDMTLIAQLVRIRAAIPDESGVRSVLPVLQHIFSHWAGRAFQSLRSGKGCPEAVQNAAFLAGKEDMLMFLEGAPNPGNHLISVVKHCL